MRKAAAVLVVVVVLGYFPETAEGSVECASPDVPIAGVTALVAAGAGIPAYFARKSRVALSGGVAGSMQPEESSSDSFGISGTGEILGMWRQFGYEVFAAHYHVTPSSCANLSTGALGVGFTYRVLAYRGHRLRAVFGGNAAVVNTVWGAGPYLGLAYELKVGAVRLAPRFRYLPALASDDDGLEAADNARVDVRVQYRTGSKIEPFVSGVVGSAPAPTNVATETYAYAYYAGGELGVQVRW